jgi:hypothetical protein
MIVHFDVPVTQAYKGTIYNSEGKMIRVVTENRLAEGTAYLTFSTGPLATGTYILAITGENGEIYREKFVVIK